VLDRDLNQSRAIIAVGDEAAARESVRAIEKAKSVCGKLPHIAQRPRKCILKQMPLTDTSPAMEAAYFRRLAELTPSERR
jgi:hypothetical protein